MNAYYIETDDAILCEECFDTQSTEYTKFEHIETIAKCECVTCGYRFEVKVAVQGEAQHD